MKKNPDKTSDERAARNGEGLFEIEVPAAVLPDGWVWRFKFENLNEHDSPLSYFGAGDLLSPKGESTRGGHKFLVNDHDLTALGWRGPQKAPANADSDALFFGPYESTLYDNRIARSGELLEEELRIAAEGTGVAPGNERALEAFARYACMEAARKIVAEASRTVEYYARGEIESPAQAAETVAEQLGASNLARGLARACGKEVAAAIKGTLEAGRAEDVIEAITETCLEFSQAGLDELNTAELAWAADVLRAELEDDGEPGKDPGKDREEREV